MNKIKKSSNETAKRGKIKFTIWGTLYNCELPLVSLVKMLDAAVKKTNTLKFRIIICYYYPVLILSPVLLL